MLQQHNAQPGDDHEHPKPSRLDQIFGPMVAPGIDAELRLCPVISASVETWIWHDRAYSHWTHTFAGMRLHSVMCSAPGAEFRVEGHAAIDEQRDPVDVITVV